MTTPDTEDRTAAQHVLGPPRLLTNGLYAVTCSCDYRTSPYKRPERATGAAQQHRHDKMQAARNKAQSSVTHSDVLNVECNRCPWKGRRLKHRLGYPCDGCNAVNSLKERDDSTRGAHA
jgi:hypothetical protein